MRAADRWRGRAATAEAMALLALARLLVARVPFARWRATLGTPASPEQGAEIELDANLAARRLARAVGRAAARLPGESRCLARAMALQWLLRRRRLSGVLHIGVRSGDARGGIDDLHAWVVRDGEVLIGGGGELHHPIYAARTPPRRRRSAEPCR